MKTGASSCSCLDSWISEGSRELIFLKTRQQARLVAQKTGNGNSALLFHWCSASVSQRVFLWVLVLALTHLSAPYLAPLSDLTRCPSKWFWHILLQDAVSKPPYVSARLLLWLLWSLLNCFVLTGLSHLKTYCWLKTYARPFFFSILFQFLKKRHYILQLNIRPQEGTLRLCFAPCYTMENWRDGRDPAKHRDSYLSSFRDLHVSVVNTPSGEQAWETSLMIIKMALNNKLQSFIQLIGT